MVDVPEDSQIHKQIIKKETNLRDFSLKSSVKTFYIEVSEPQLDSLESDFARLRNSLKDDWNVQEVTCSINILKDLQEKLRKGNWEVTDFTLFQRKLSTRNHRYSFWIFRNTSIWLSN